MNSRLRDVQLLGLAALLFSGCAVTAEQKKPVYADLVIETEPAEDPFPTHSANAQFHVLAGEMAAGRNQPELAAREFLKALKFVADPDLAERATGLAVAARNEELTLSAARRWLELEPQAMDAREVIARIALNQGLLAEVAEQCEAIVRGHAGGEAEGFRHVSLLLSQASEEHGEGAIAVLQQLAAKWPELAGAHHGLGLLALRFGKLDLADAAVHRAIELEPDNKEHTLLLIGILIKQEKLSEADAAVDKLVAGDERAAELRMGYARLLLESNQREHARRQLQLALELDPAFTDARFALGVLAINDRDYAAAESYLRPLLDGERGKDAALQLGRMEEARRNYDKAIEYYSRVNTGTQALDAIVRRAAVLAKTGRIEEAQAIMGELRDSYPHVATRFYLAEGEFLVNAGAYSEALAMYDEALEKAPRDADLLYGRSLVHERMKNIDLAEKDLRTVLREDKDDARALNALGYMLTVHTKRLQEAHELVSRALELDPDDAAIIDSMGWIQYKLGNRQEAREWLQKAFDRFPDAEVAAHLGEVLWVMGEREQARAIWNQALKDDPDHRVLNETVKRLTQ